MRELKSRKLNLSEIITRLFTIEEEREFQLRHYSNFWIRALPFGASLIAGGANSFVRGTDLEGKN